jgi:hypothetical protein
MLATPLLSAGCAGATQDHFATPEQASEALADALRSGDAARLKQILGPDADEVVSSGDAVADRQQAQKFLLAYDEKHALTADRDDGQVTLLVGKADWPFPIPVVRKGPGWEFDTERGKDEILSRRIGRNELFTIQVCLAVVDAQREYARRDPDGDGLPDYAKKLRSDPGTRDGLYWEAAPGEEPSPIGPLVAAAAKEGYAATRPAADRRPPFHGYNYRLLTAQGPGAPGGARDYLVRGELLGGFAVVAWPADYGNSGIMTFIVNQDGAVYQKDLGPDTERAARAISVYDPAGGWTRAERGAVAPVTGPGSTPSGPPVAAGATGDGDEDGRVGP